MLTVFVASNNCFHQAIILKSDGSVSTRISISPTSALIVLHPCDCRAVVRMLLECWMHKGNIWTAEYLLLPFSLSKLLLGRKVPNFRMCKNKTNCANRCIASCGSRELAARDRASLYSAHAQSASSDWWSIHRLVCVSELPISCTSLCALVQLEVLLYDRWGQGILLL